MGTQTDPLKSDWRVQNQEILPEVFFSKHPRSIRGGDLLVYYAARHQKLPAIAQVVSDDVHDYGKDTDRFRYSMAVRPIVTVSLREAPSLSDTTISPLSVRRQSHIYLKPREFQVARLLILEAVEREFRNVVEMADEDDDQPAAA